MSSKKIRKVSFCISTNGSKVGKTNMLVASIFGMLNVDGVGLDITITGCVNEFKNLDNVKLIDACDYARSGMLSGLRFIAAENIDTDIIVFVDDDFLFPESWLINLLDFSRKESWSILGNRILLPNGDRFWDRASFSPHRMISYDSIGDENIYQTGGFWVVNSSAYEKCKWNPDIPINATTKGFKHNEDVEMSLRAKRLGLNISFDKNNLVWHNDKSYRQSGDIILKIPEGSASIYGTSKEFLNLYDSLKAKPKQINEQQ